MGTRAAYLAMTLLALGPAAGARAQGLVITPLPSQQVIEAVTPPMPEPATQPTQADPGRETPPRADLPRPSIIIGDRAVLAAFDPRGPLGFAFEARQAIRQRDAALFDRLLGDGAFDPDTGRLAEAIQTELRRMACYAGSIDGAWGSGSAGAVRRWSQVAQSQAGDSPDMALYRAILHKDEVECAAPAVAAPAQPAATPRAAAARAAPARDNRAAPATARAAPARSQPRKPQPAASTPAPASRQINPSLMGSGLFR